MRRKKTGGAIGNHPSRTRGMDYKETDYFSICERLATKAISAARPPT
jgi:hypothetical protein